MLKRSYLEAGADARWTTVEHRFVDSLESRVLFSTHMVDLNAPGPVHDGTSWAQAFTTIQAALLAAAPGDEIRIADGSYSPGASQSYTFQLKNAVELIGGYAGYGAVSPNSRNVVDHPTILIAPPVPANARAVYTIITATAVDSSTILDGLTIKGAPEKYFGDDGEGMMCQNGSPIVQNCTFIDLTGGAANSSFSSPTFVDCTFSNNSNGYGGAMFASYSSLSILRCRFLQNSSTVGDGSGGAIYASNCQVDLTGCDFIRNRARRGSGGALCIIGDATISLCKFYANSAYLSGGAIVAGYGLDVVDSAFVGNVAVSDGGAIAGSGFSVRRCTFTENRSSREGGAVASYDGGDIFSSIFWRDSAYYHNEISAPSASVFANDIQGGPDGFSSEVYGDFDPLFVRAPSPGADGTWATGDDDYGNLQLQPYSQCIDKADDMGFPEITADSKDLAGNPRLVDFPEPPHFPAYLDLGAYETPAATIVSCMQFLVDAPQPQLKITFNTDIVPTNPGALVLINLNTGENILQNHWYELTFSYDPQTYAITIAFPPGILTDGHYKAFLPGAAVRDLAGNPSVASRDYTFFVMAGDANRDQKVNAADLEILAANWQGSSRTFCQGDFNYDGRVDLADLGILASGWQKTLLAPPTAVSTASVARRTPTRVASTVLN